jgi:hypothetical protein
MLAGFAVLYLNLHRYAPVQAQTLLICKKVRAQRL